MHRFAPRRWLIGALVLAALVACAPVTTTQPTAVRPPYASAASRASAPITKVLVFVEENHSLAEMKLGMPYTFGLATLFGYASAYTAIRHPSLPNYIAIAGGKTYGIVDDNPPPQNAVGGVSIFGQALAAGRTAMLFAEGMPANCSTADSGSYAVKHNPWAYFTAERGSCAKYDVPIARLSQAVRTGTLPTVGAVIPDLCNDAHDCSLATADEWFRGWMTAVFSGRDWKSGHLAVVLTADEDDKSAGNAVLTVVIHPSQRAHVVATALTHYSLTRFCEDVAGAPHLFGAKSAPSLSRAFGLPLGISAR